MGKLGGAVAEGAQLIENLYQSFYQELQKPLLSRTDATDTGSAESGRDAAAAKVACHTHPQSIAG